MVAVAVLISCTAALPLGVAGQSPRSDGFVVERPLLLCRSGPDLERTASATSLRAGPAAARPCVAADAWSVSAAAGAGRDAFRMEPRYPLLGMLIGAAAGGAVAAIRVSTIHGEVTYPMLAVRYVPAGALAGLALGLYIGAKADE